MTQTCPARLGAEQPCGGIPGGLRSAPGPGQLERDRGRSLGRGTLFPLLRRAALNWDEWSTKGALWAGVSLLPVKVASS